MLRRVPTGACLWAFLTVFGLLLTVQPVRAQFVVGLEVGANVNRLSFDDEDFLSSTNRVGFFAGPKICATIRNLGLGIDAAALYSRRSAAVSGHTSDGAVISTRVKDLNYIEVPVNIRWNIGSSMLGIYVATGPQLDWFIGNRNMKDLYANRSAVFEDRILSWNVGAGVRLLKHAQLGVTYNIPVSSAGTVTDTIKKTVSTENLKLYSWQVRLNIFI